jgi:S1-C subfamily serine protease
VFVDSVKPGGAAEVAGLVAGDMILKVYEAWFVNIIGLILHLS